MNKIIFSLVAIFFGWVASAQPTNISERSCERVIFDTDVGGDVDDAGALAVLHSLAAHGEIEILAIGVVIGHKDTVPFVHAVNTWYGSPDLPIGTIKGEAPYSRDEYMGPIVAEYPHTLTQETAPDVVKLYREVLASQPDQSVTLVAVGPATNIYNLLNSAPDEISPLNGIELMRRKIKFYGAGGNGNCELPKGRCGFNYRMDLTASSGETKLLPSDFPTVYAGGSGSILRVGAAYKEVRPDHIIRRSYEEYYDGTAKDRQAWDQLRVLYAFRPSSRFLWNTSLPGNVQVWMDGVIAYSPEPNLNRSWAYVNDFITLREMLSELMIYDPRDN
ncbi:MAG: nucleoside hydrolase [Mariniphaga sp.]|nr:nucleoside hydrolase [Mariniphaga sp.]